MDLHFSAGTSRISLLDQRENPNVTPVSCKPAQTLYAAIMRERSYYVYIIASRTRVLYTGMTGNIEARAVQHKTKYFAGFTADYNCCRLVWYESYDNPNRAIAREKQIKRWTRAKKLALIHKVNPTWIDLSENWGKPLKPLTPEVWDDPQAATLARQARGSSGALG